MEDFKIQIDDINENETQQYAPIFKCVGKLFGDYIGVYFKLNVDGVDYILQRRDDMFILYREYEEGKVSYDMFTIDDEYNVDYAVLDDFQFKIDGGNKVILRHDSCVAECLTLKHRDEVDVDGYNGFVQYIQYNQEKDVQLMIIYQQRYNERGEIHGYHIYRSPFQITIQKGVGANENGSKIPIRTTRYIRGNIDEKMHPHLYNIALIKDYGLVEFLEKGTCALQKDDQMVRYYKVLGLAKNGMAITAFPFCTQYKYDDFSSMFDKYGFASKIPYDLIELHNGNNRELRKYEAIATFMKEIEMAPPDQVIELKLKFEGSEENGTNN